MGMSTVPEAIVARHAGMEVLAFALVTNAAAGVVGTPITHKEVLEAGKKATPMLGKLIRRVVLRLSGIDPDKAAEHDFHVLPNSERPRVLDDRSSLCSSDEPRSSAYVVADQAVHHLISAGVPEHRGRMRGGHADGVHARGPGGLDAEGGVLEDHAARWVRPPPSSRL